MNLSKLKILNKIILSIACLAFGFNLFSCNTEDSAKTRQQQDPEKIKESLIKANKAFVEAENEAINDYITRHHLNLNKSKSGLRYEIESSGTGNLIRPGQSVELKYNMFLLDGTFCYSSDSTGTMKFKVEQSDAVNGMHEAVQLMRTGDKAILILPAHLAYGLTGDNDKIPPASALVLNVQLIKAM